MQIKLTYNELKIFLTSEDYEQIKDMPEPSLVQAQLVIKKWKDYYDERICEEDSNLVLQGRIMLKVYLKAKGCYPELFV